MKIYTYPQNKNAFKALIAAEYVGAKIEVPAFEMGVDNKSEDFLKNKNPHGKVPVLETEDGCIFESNAIARYVARLADVGLMGSTPLETALVEQWIDFSASEFDGPLFSWVLPIMGIWPYDKKKEQGAIAALKAAMPVLDSHLKENTFLVGDSVTLADIVTVCNLYLGFTMVMDAGFRKDFPHLERYFITMVNQPQFAKVMGEVKLCEQPMKYTPPKKDKKGGGDAKKEAAQEEKPKKEEKPKSWLDLLPPSKMAMDSWKRLYANSPSSNFRAVCIERLWKGGPVPNSPTSEEFVGFDPEGYSFWFCEYKYVDENTVNFIVMNKVGGFLQRVEYARKYAFGVMCILKDDKGQFPIRGVWMFRGQELPPQMVEECGDMELYEWTKVDLNDEAQKKRLADMICEEETVDGLEHIECKVFK